MGRYFGSSDWYCQSFVPIAYRISLSGSTYGVSPLAALRHVWMSKRMQRFGAGIKKVQARKQNGKIQYPQSGAETEKMLIHRHSTRHISDNTLIFSI
jgi:hypothetical protein